MIKETAHFVGTDIVFDERPANGTHQYECQRAAFYFFVLSDQVHQYVNGWHATPDVLHMGGQADRCKMRGGARRLRRREQPFLSREFESERHAERHCLPVQQPIGEAAACFQRVAERMPKIEQRPFAGLALIARHNIGFRTAANRNCMLARGTTGENILPVLFKPSEERGIAE